MPSRSPKPKKKLNPGPSPIPARERERERESPGGLVRGGPLGLFRRKKLILEHFSGPALGAFVCDLSKSYASKTPVLV